jgi:hypothetical protein
MPSAASGSTGSEPEQPKQDKAACVRRTCDSAGGVLRKKSWWVAIGPHRIEPRFTLFTQPLKPRQSEAYPANAHGKHMGVAFNTHDREIEDIGLATSRDDGVAIRGRNDRQPLPDGDLVAKIAPHDEMRHVFELADIDLRGSGAPEGSTATSA